MRGDFIKIIFGSEKGSITTMSAMTMPVVMAMVGLGIDSSNWMMNKQNLQTAADAAAIAAAWEAARQHEDVMTTIAETEAVHNGYQPERNGDIRVRYSDNVSGATGEVTVTLSQDADLFFSKLIMADVRISASARAIVTEPGYDFCILGLDEDESGAVTTSGNVDLSMPDCGIAVNSDSDDALLVHGNVDIDVEDINIVGDMEVSGNSASITYDTLRTNGSVVYDPYANVNIPPFVGCSAADMRHGTRINRNTTLSPGVYCGGITITGNNTVTFDPGVYILDGGGLSITGSGMIVAHDVTIILTNSGSTSYGSYGTFDITGSRNLYLSAIDTGDTAGIVLYQDRNAPSNGVNRIMGNNIVEVDGVIYTPNQELNYGGGVEISSEVCTQLIGRTVVLHGTPYLGTSCDGSSSRPIGLVRARLSG